MKSDTIYRQDAIEAVDNACRDWRGTFRRCEDALKALPSADPDVITMRVDIDKEQFAKAWKQALASSPLTVFPLKNDGWIPVTERLPEDGENVLVTYKTTDKIHPCQYHDDGSLNPWYSYIDQCRAHMNVVLAWMPLPEPYKEEKDE